AGGRCSTSPIPRWSAAPSCWWCCRSSGSISTRSAGVPPATGARTRTTPETARVSDRSMPVPEGLAGMRVDAGLARLLGLSRSAAAALAEDGGVELDGVAAGKSDRLAAGAWLQVRLPEPPAPLEDTPAEVEGMTILYSDDDIVAVDKPPGVAAHASVG